jgi:hypothetical protein
VTLSRPLSVLVFVGAALAFGSAGAYAAVVLRGQGELVAEPAEWAGLQVDDVHLAAPLTPGGSADLILTVRNRSTVYATADRLVAPTPLREARPAGCTTKVSGPLLAKAGLKLTGAQRASLSPGSGQVITVPGALRLAATAKTGCGFRLTINVEATELPRPPVVIPPTFPVTPTPTPPKPSIKPSESPEVSAGLPPSFEPPVAGPSTDDDF